MGQKLFGVDISGLIKKYVGTGLTDVTLTKVTKGTRTTSQLTAGTNPTTQDFPCRGVIVRQNKGVRGDARTVSDGTQRILLIGDTISNGNVAPSIGDHITAEGTVFLIEEINRDPARATYSCTVRVR